MKFEKLQAAVIAHGGIRPAARALNIAESTLRTRLKNGLRDLLYSPDGEKSGKGFEPKYSHNRLPPATVFKPGDTTRYFILTAAQDDTAIHEDFWNCLNVYAEWLEDCEILVSGFTYNKKLFEEHDKRADNIFYHPAIDTHIVHNQALIGDHIVFCGEMNTLPTAVKPLSGFATYTRARWGIFPHVKVQLESVPTMKNALTKQNMTTGAITLPNYIRKKAGIKAEFDHIIGATLVALAPDGSFWCRHIQATSMTDGSFYDLDCHITANGVSEGHRIAGITYGDIHHEKIDRDVALATWGYDPETQTRSGSMWHIPDNFVGSFKERVSLIDHLRPEFEFYHDLSDFSPRNHHNVKDHHHIYATYINGTDSVEDALAGCGQFLKAVARDDCLSVVIQSNHDNALVTWLKTIGERVKTDPVNYEFYLETELAFVRYLKAGISAPPVFEDVLRLHGAPADVIFHPEDKSFMVNGIECGMHGHLGANGAKASPNAFERMGSKSNTGHVHSPGITSGNYRSGVCSLLLGYNKGLSSWAITHTVIYPNGKRALLTYMNGRFYD